MYGTGNVQTKVIVGATIAAGTLTAAGLLYLYKKKIGETPPKKWKKVGEIVDINFFPIKSCGPIKKDSFDCHILGLETQNILDRSFMVVSPGRNCVTARAHPKLLHIEPRIDGNKLILSAPNMLDIEVNVDELKKEKTSKAVVWSQKVDVIDAGDAVSDWISEFILGSKGGLRLVFYPNLQPTRSIPASDRKFKLMTKVDAGALQDVNNYMLMNLASVDELNTHLDHPVKPLQYRPNFLVKGPNAYEEDSWKWIRIGDDVVFRNIRPCTRCMLTTIDPDTATRNPDRQPLKTLIKLRSIVPDEAPVLGIHLGLRSNGRVSLGDAVYVEDE